MRAADVRVETVELEARIGMPYRQLGPRYVLRIAVGIAPPGERRREVMLEIDDSTIAIHDPAAPEPRELLVDHARLFVVDRQPPGRWRFFTWYGVFVRRFGRADELIVETPDPEVARFIEHAIERRLQLDDGPVHGELRVGR